MPLVQKSQSLIFAKFRKSDAFSLIEVVLAMSIVSFAFITMMGLLSTGLTTFQNGTSSAVTSQIAQQVMSCIQETGADLYPQGLAYYDDQGNPLAAANKSKAIYQAELNITTTTLPGCTTPNPNLATVTLIIARNPGNIVITDWLNPPVGVSVSVYSTQVANSH